MKNKHIAVCISGSIAAYKAADLVSRLTKEQAEVRVVMTKHAAAFIAPLTLASLSHHPVFTDEFDGTNEDMIPHIALAKWADAIILAPASANIIAKAANGIADDLASSMFLAATCPKLAAPAMNVHMFENPTVQRNIETLKKDGWTIIEPEEGLLACQDTGKGRLASTDTLIEALKKVFEKEEKNETEETEKSRPLAGFTVAVSAGPTHESLDPVRYMTNHSTGKQGYALAQRARDLGADVILVSGPCNLPKPDGVSFVPVKSAVEMQQAMEKAAESADWIIMAAAVADYRPASCALQKIKKSDSNMTVEFVRNPDILKGLGEKKREDQVLCGFAMETENLLENAKKKLEGKHCDLLAANNLNTPGAGFANDTNVISLLSKEGVRQLPLLSKEDTADAILLHMLEISREKKKGN